MGKYLNSKVIERRKEILCRSVGIDYNRFFGPGIIKDYDGLMNEVTLSLQEIMDVQKETFVGNTPLLELKNITKLVRKISQPGKGARIFLKDEAVNPTGSFKDRRATLPVYFAKKMGYKGVVAATSGNFGAAVASNAARLGLSAIVIQEVYDSTILGQPESLEKGRACESYGAEVQQFSVGPESFTYAILETLDQTGYFSASLYLPHSIAGIESLGSEISHQMRATCGRDPDAVLITHAGGGNVTGTARGLKKAGYKGEIIAVSVDLGELNLHDDKQFARKSFSTGHTGYGKPSLYKPDEVDVPINAARPLRYIDRYVTVSQGEVYYVTEILAQLEGLQRGPAGNTSLAAAIAIAKEMDENQILVVQESEYTGAGKSHTAQLTFAVDNGVEILTGNPREEVPGKNIILPDHPALIQVEEVDLREMRLKYIEHNVKNKGIECINQEELNYLSEEINQDRKTTSGLLSSVGIKLN
jgi:2-amino-4-ketopentanoate thiolase beta subunit